MSTDQSTLSNAVQTAVNAGVQQSTRRVIPKEVKQAAVAELALGAGLSATARKYKIDVSQLRKLALARPLHKAVLKETTKSVQSWRDAMKGDAVKAVSSALRDPSDQYKRGAIGVQALRGLGEFVERQQIEVAAIVATVPQALDSGWITLECEPSTLTIEPESE